MQPLTDQPSRTSLLSWWSDSNPGLKGPTINIHAMAKPLMRLLYHRQAMQFIKDNAGVPITAAVLEIYSTYLLCKYVSSATQCQILKELGDRARNEIEVSTISNSSVLAELSSLLNNKHPSVVEHALRALAKAARWLDGAQAVIKAGVQDQALKLLESPNPMVRQVTRSLVQNLAQYEATAAMILKINPCVQLVSLLPDEHPDVVERAIKALANAARWHDGAPVVVQATTQNHLLKLLESQSPVVRESASRLMANLAHYEATAATVLKINPCVQLFLLLQLTSSGDQHPDIVKHAILALANAALWLGGAQAAIQVEVQNHVLKLLESPNPVAKVQHHVLTLFESPNAVVREWTCRLVGDLAYHKAIASRSHETHPGQALVLLLRGDSCSGKISNWPGGVAAIADMGVAEVL
ncbi:armadillo-type protein [Mycena capillaripes]|nr:armadillo-type protein [Mycena capillaripes]